MKKSIALIVALGVNTLIAQPSDYNLELDYGKLKGTHHTSVFRTKSQIEFGLMSYMPLHSGLYEMPYRMPLLSLVLSTVSLGVRFNHMPHENWMFEFQSFHGVSFLSFYPEDARGFFYSDIRIGANFIFERKYRSKKVPVIVSKEDYEKVKRTSPKVLGISTFTNHRIFVSTPTQNYFGLRGGLDVLTMPLEENLLQGLGNTLMGVYTGFMYGSQHDATLTLNNGNRYFIFNSSYFYMDIQYAQASFSYAQITELQNNPWGFRVGVRSFHSSDSRFSTQLELGKQSHLNDVFARVSFCMRLK